MSSDMAQPRSSSGSGRASSTRSRQGQPPVQPQQQLSTIEKSVTHLLVATKQLLETLTMWSRGAATETEVSDVYVRLGYEFNIASRAFNNIGVDTSDLGPVPDLLRAILEDTLSQEASQASLDKFLPRIRDIIINLLHGLKKKQSRLRQRTAQTSASSSSLPREGSQTMRQASVTSTSSNDTTVTQALDDASRRHQSYLQRSASSEVGSSIPDLPPRTTSVQSNRQSPRRDNFAPPTTVHRPRGSAEDTYSSIDSSLSNNAVQASQPDIPYQPEPVELSAEPRSPPTKQMPMQRDALAALQRGGDLERRASRRLSSFQLAKQLGTANSITNMIPAAQHSPIPNRGRETRESINAVRNRSGMAGRSRSAYRVEQDASPARKEQQVSRDDAQVESPPEVHAVPPQDPFGDHSSERKQMDFTFPGNDMLESADNHSTNGVDAANVDDISVGVSAPTLPQPIQTEISPAPQFIPESSPQPGKELTLFLQFKSKIKKFVLADGADLTIPRLQLAFIEKFAWNTHNNGVDLPEIYIQDPVSGVRHELEDLSDIKDRTVLVLNVEVLDEVKRHFDDGVDGLKRMIEGIKTTVDGQQAALQRVSDRQQDAAKEIATLAATPARPLPTPPTTTTKPTPAAQQSNQQLDELQALRRDLAIVRQTYTSFKSNMDTSMAEVRAKAAAVQTKSKEINLPSVTATGGRAYVNNGKKSLQDDSEKIVTAVDDLQDTVEDLRKDVVTRGVRPLPRQLETVSKDISLATAQLKKLQDFLKREKPVWTKIWEKELQVVCDDREILTLQEELCIDLEDDLDKAAATFALVEQATRQQALDNPKTMGRSTSRTLELRSVDQSADPLKAKDGVLGEVKALRPNHETRLEAIERAERARQKELEGRKEDGFSKELGNFVEEGRLKKSGGVEEVERQRKLKDERAIRGYYDRIAARNGGGEAPVADQPAVTEEEAQEETSDAEVKTDTLEVPDKQEESSSPDAGAFVEASEHPL